MIRPLPTRPEVQIMRRCRLLIRPAFAASLIVLALLTSACGGARPPPEDVGEILRGAVNNARSAANVRVRGEIRSTGPIFSWEGVVVGAAEQYRIAAMGMVIDARRIDGLAWGRLPNQPWISVPSDGSFDLGVLLRGQVDTSAAIDGGQQVELRFADVDVLRALSHVPSTGRATVTVTIQDDLVTAVDIRLANGISAHEDLWDYGAALTVEPVDS